MIQKVNSNFQIHFAIPKHDLPFIPWYREVTHSPDVAREEEIHEAV